MTFLRAAAIPFSPLTRVPHRVRPRISWSPQGVTDCASFFVVKCEAYARGRQTPFDKGLYWTHAGDRASKIRTSDPVGAAPFKIPAFPIPLSPIDLPEWRENNTTLVRQNAVPSFDPPDEAPTALVRQNAVPSFDPPDEGPTAPTPDGPPPTKSRPPVHPEPMKPDGEPPATPRPRSYAAPCLLPPRVSRLDYCQN